MMVMQEMTEPELDRKERWTRDYILEFLPSEYGNPSYNNDEELGIAKSILAKQYVEHANLDVAWKTGLILILYDMLFLLHSQIYGLVLGTLGSIALALPTLYTPELLAQDAFNKSDALMSEIKSKAELSVKTNVGVAGLAVGFVWQVFSVSGPIPKELISKNYLQGSVENWIGFVAVFIFGFLIFGVAIPAIRKQS